jgi:hypothetical protein
VTMKTQIDHKNGDVSIIHGWFKFACGILFLSRLINLINLNILVVSFFSISPYSCLFLYIYIYIYIYIYEA